jgi:hypothetical protein
VKKKDIADLLAEENPEAMLADGFEEAFIGVAHRSGQSPLAVYDCDKCVQILMERDGLDETDAWEYLVHNSVGAWVGEGTPLWVHRAPQVERCDCGRALVVSMVCSVCDDLRGK